MFRSALILATFAFQTAAWAVPDADGDGYSAVDDCDDNDPTVNPGATDVCNGVDDDCDGTPDPTKETWYADRDSDGYGVNGETRRVCPGDPLPPINVGTWSLEKGDCFDTNANMSPGLPEVCDGLDNDCDGDINEGIPAQNWHPDFDNDGFGSDDETLTVSTACAPAMYVASMDDCNDNADGVHPDATEVCDNFDQDCNGMADDGLATHTWYPDADKDGYGEEAAAVDTCSHPAKTIAIGGDCDDSSAEISPEADEVCDDVDNNCDGIVDEDEAVDAQTFYADWDKDGYINPNITHPGCSVPTDGNWLPDSEKIDCNDSNATQLTECTAPPTKTGCATTNGVGSVLAGALALLALRRRRA